MTDIDWFGADGGRLAVAFGTGWATCLALLTGVVVIAFRFVTRSHEDRLKAAEAGHEECRRDNEQLKREVELLRNLLLLHGPAQLRKELGAVISELHMDVRRVEDQGGKS